MISQRGIKASFLIVKFFSQEIDSQYNLIKMLLAKAEKYKDVVDAIKGDIAYLPIEIKK